MNYTFEAAADSAAIAGDRRSATMNGFFSLFNKLVVKSGRKPTYNVNNIHKLIFIKNLLDCSDDYARNAEKSQFWYLYTTNDTVTAAGATNLGIKVRGALAHAGTTFETLVQLNRYSLFLRRVER